MATPRRAIDLAIAASSPLRWRRWWWPRTSARPLLVLAIGGGLGVALAAYWGLDIALPLAIAIVAVLPLASLRRLLMPAADTVLLVGNSPSVAILTDVLREPRPAAGRLSSINRTLRRTWTVLQVTSLADAAEHVRAVRCDRVIVAEPVASWMPDLVDARRRRPTIVSEEEAIEDLLRRVPLDLVAEERWSIGVDDGRRVVRPGYALVKRGLDVVVALAIGLAALPLVPFVALMIRLDSPGAVFFSQVRVGLGGCPFRLWKFRTMCVDADGGGPVWVQRNDPRVTRVGRFLRRTRIDELPQLWNVLRGEMTVVGPRPLRPHISAAFEEKLPAYALRHTVRPGLTGWAQVCGGYADSEHAQWRKFEYDLYYIKRASIGLDLRILLRTVTIVLGMRGR